MTKRIQIFLVILIACFVAAACYSLATEHLTDDHIEHGR